MADFAAIDEKIVKENNDSVVSKLEEIIINREDKYPLFQRYRALFSLKGLGTNEAAEVIIRAAKEEKKSELFKHELAYCLGQLKNKESIPLLKKLISDKDEFVMVRHEAAEALGAISEPDTIETLKQHLNDECQELADTCYLAIKKINIETSADGLGKDIEKLSTNKYGSIDPVPSLSRGMSVPVLREMIIDQKADLFDRYTALFGLRDDGSPEAAAALLEALETDNTSALFRHEVAFVFGELQDPSSVQSLARVLGNTNEHPMVRHEAAEALGSIIGSKNVLEILSSFSSDPDMVVRDSCIVAIDMYNYENSNEFQYAIIPS
ncbi:Deoxyhypusine hydroxylase [Smittium mucronatum]|uniref:Deoxyhypusine hydroxylase n=1 Tax=Smittium mucronatum TaxID=133383 RepID=A0A1R0H2X3_9FUNG|nr:Deoxyhypusine hydroxylase [Smittium mucronatum]